MPIALEQSLSVKEVAEQMGVSPDLVRKWCREGDLIASNVGGSRGYVILAKELAAFQQRRFSQEPRERAAQSATK